MFQALIGRDPTLLDELWRFVDAFQADFPFICHSTDEQVQGLVLDSNAGEYLVRAESQALPNGQQQVVAQLIADLVHRPATVGELLQYGPQIALDPARTIHDQLADALNNLPAVAQSIALLEDALAKTDPTIGPEYRAVVVNQAFQSILGRAPSANELDTFVTALGELGVKEQGCGAQQQLHTDEEARALLYASGDYCGGNAQIEVAFPGVVVSTHPTIANVGEQLLGLQQNAIGTLQTQISNLNLTVTALQAQVSTAMAIESSAILDLFGLKADANVATGARDVAYGQIQAARGAVGGANLDLQHAMARFAEGTDAQSAGDYTRAFVRFRQAYGDASLALGAPH
jgi:hypothetical protein